MHRFDIWQCLVAAGYRAELSSASLELRISIVTRFAHILPRIVVAAAVAAVVVEEEEDVERVALDGDRVAICHKRA